MIHELVTAITAAGLLLASPAETQFTNEVWEQNQDITTAILEHPFLKKMQEGTLPRRVFAFYLIQDAFYLGQFARALKVTAAKAPNEDWKKLLLRDASESIEEERRLHERVLEDSGVSQDRQSEMGPAPEAFAYTSFLIATAHSRPFAESIAALLPCYWIYWEVGKELVDKGSPEPNYQKWIDTYASESYGETVKTFMAIANQVAEEADPETLEKMKEHFRRACRYEWMFWDSAYAERRWPPP